MNEYECKRYECKRDDAWEKVLDAMNMDVTEQQYEKLLKLWEMAGMQLRNAKAKEVQLFE